ncbi:MAG: putative aminohydrolase SsnA [Clostridiales bacterium]|nr:putative aminohydrolase SsnA [Clostridiales bacterium]
MTKLIGNGILITRNIENPIINDGCVAISANKIIDYGITSEMKRKYANCEFYDVKGKIIMPGLINTHNHIYSAMARGMVLNDAKVSKNFTQVLENLWWRLDRGLGLIEIKYSAYTTYIDCIKNGVTTVFDHHASAGQVTGSLFTIAEVAKELGVRTSLCYEVSDRDGIENTDLGIKENVDFIEYAKEQNNDMIKAMFGLHASFTLSDETLEKCVNAANNTGFHVHVAEGTKDLEDSQEKYNKRVVERLFDMKILGVNTIAVHCIHVDNHELDIIKSTDSIVVHNPESNMGNAVGCSDVLSMMQKDILVGLGTDGYTTDMFESLKVANIIHKHEHRDPSVAWKEAPQMLLDNNATICSRFFEEPLGIIEKDALADIIVVDYTPPTPMNENNINSHILFGFSGRNVVSTIINGQYVMKDRVVLTADENEIYHKSQSVAKDFWERV